MDRMGTCDPYVMLVVASPPQRHQTKVVKNSYGASWEDEMFDIELGGGGEEMLVRVMDWDVIGEDELVGTAHVPAASMLLEAARMPTTTVVGLQCAKGAPVTGRDGQPTTVTLEFSEMPPPPVAASCEAAAEREVEVPGTLHVTLVGAAGLPKMDTFTHRADPYLVVQCGAASKPYKTAVKRNTLKPLWEERCVFECISGASALQVTMYDYNWSSKDQLMGTVVIPVRSSACPAADYPLTGVLEGGEPCKGTVRLSTTFVPGAAPSARPREGKGSGKVSVKVTVGSVSSLPRMDLAGKCDPYVVVTVGGESRETGHKSNVYEATWGKDGPDATFYFSSGNDGVIEAAVWDWNRVSKSTWIGTARINVGDLSSGEEASSEYVLYDAKGREVMGHDGVHTMVGLEVLVQPQEVVGDGDEGGDGEGGMWDVCVGVKRCEHMPKMDALLGTCDPLVTVRLGAKEQATKALRNRYEGDWKDEQFQFTTHSVDEELVFTAWDYDTATRNDFIGMRRRSMREYEAAAADGVEVSETILDLIDKNGNLVKGHDGYTTVLYVTIKVTRQVAQVGQSFIAAVTKGLDIADTCRKLRGKPWKLKVWVVSGEHLPKTDTLGLCDPFVTLSVDGGKTEQKTSVIKNTLSPYWDEHFVFNPVKCPMLDHFLTLVLWDKDALSQETVGVAKIPLGAIAAAADRDWPPIAIQTKQVRLVPSLPHARRIKLV